METGSAGNAAARGQRIAASLFQIRRADQYGHLIIGTGNLVSQYGFSVVDGQDVLAFYALATFAVTGAHQHLPAVNGHVTFALDAFGGRVQVAVNGLRTGGDYFYYAALDVDVSVAIDAFAKVNIFVATDAMLVISRHRELALAAQNQLSFAEQACLFVFAFRRCGVSSPVRQGVRCAERAYHKYPLLALYVDGRPFGACDAGAIQGELEFIIAIYLKSTVRGVSAQYVFYLLCGGSDGDIAACTTLTSSDAPSTVAVVSL